MTIVSFSKQIIFIKTKKTASTSVEAFLRKWTDKDDIVTPLTPRDEKWCIDRGLYSYNYSEDPAEEIEYTNLCKAEKYDEALVFLKKIKQRYNNHMSASDIKLKLKRLNYHWDDFYSFSIDRNPASWLLSFLLYDNKEYNEKGKCDINFDNINRQAELFLKSPRFDRNFNFKMYTFDNELIVNDLLKYECLKDEISKALSCRLMNLDVNSFPDLKKNSRSYSPEKIFSEEVMLLIKNKFQPLINLKGYEL